MIFPFWRVTIKISQSEPLLVPNWANLIFLWAKVSHTEPKWAIRRAKLRRLDFTSPQVLYTRHQLLTKWQHMNFGHKYFFYKFEPKFFSHQYEPKVFLPSIWAKSIPPISISFINLSEMFFPINMSQKYSSHLFEPKVFLPLIWAKSIRHIFEPKVFYSFTFFELNWG